MPNPKKNEAKQDFLKRCTQELVDTEGRTSKQSYAMCNVLWGNDGEDSVFNLSAPVKLLAADEDKPKKRSFLITAKTSEPVVVWGETVAIDIKGIRTDAKLPILREHSRTSIVGHGSAFKKDQTLYIEGEFSETTQDAQEVLALADEGYPWQASIGLFDTSVEYLEAGKTEKVNGHKIIGPAAIVRTSMVREVSFVTIGADEKTAAIALNSDENKHEKENLNMNLHELKEKHPDLVKQIETETLAATPTYDDGREDGVKAERMRVIEIMEAEADSAKTLTAIKDGTLSVDAYKEFFLAGKKNRADKLEKLEGEATKSQGHESDPVTGKGFMVQVDEYKAAHSCDLTAAMKAIIKIDPAAHEAYLAENNK